MRNLLFTLLSVFLILQAGIAQLPPIIDREIFFDDPEISSAQLSPDGKYVSFVKPFNNVRNIWLKERHEPFDKARPMTADMKRPVVSYFWSHDSRYILYSQDKGGDENFRIYAVDPAQPGDPVPEARDLTPMENIRATIISVPRATPNEILIGLNDRKPELHDVYRLNLTTGERSLVRQNNENIAGWQADLQGNLRLALKLTPTGGTEILRVDDDGLKQIYEVTSDESCSPIRFLPDGQSFYLITNKGEKVDKTQLEIFDLKTGKTKFIEKDPDDQVDLSNVIFSDMTNELQATVYVGDRIRVYPRQKEFARTWERLKKAVPDGNIGLGSRTADEKLWIVFISRDVDPGSAYLFDVATGKAELLYRSRPHLPIEHLAPMKAVRYKARDGLSIPAYLTLPKGVPGKNLPTVIVPHGGPWARDLWGYNATAQFLANRGYAVLQPNFRGSTGYGKKFLNAGNKQWGTGAMQHDITDGVQYLIKEGIADPKRVAIYGGSYGGYATLAGLAFTPEIYAAGVSFVGPSNIITLLNSIPPYWAPAKKMFAVRVGDMENPQELKMLEEQSPLNSARRIKAPLLVVQGANDPRVKKAESDQIVVAMRELGRPVEYIVAPDEGHGFLGKENRLAFFTAMEKFLAKHVGGRYQELVRDDIRKKLDEITVDVSSVTMPERPKAEASGAMPTFDGGKVKPYTAKYKTTMSAMGREFTSSTSRQVMRTEWNGKKVWRVIDDATGAMGSATDTLDLDATTLLPIRRSAKQGQATMTFTFKPDIVEGKISGPMEMPITIKTDSPVLADDAGTEIPIGTLPLAEGYQASFKTVDIMSAKTKGNTLKVAGRESVTVAGKTFDTFRVEITPVEGEGATKLWIAKDTRQMVKMEKKIIGQMGAVNVVGELVE